MLKRTGQVAMQMFSTVEAAKYVHFGQDQK